MMRRREFLGAAGSATAIVGFAQLGSGWVTAAQAESGTPYDATPALDGELVFDETSREAVATDLGNITHRRPDAVLRPGSARDIAAMVRFCRTHRVPVSVRGQAHTTHGQGLCGGLVVELRSLNRIHSIGPHAAEVDAGIHWMDLVKAAYQRSPRLTPPVITGYTRLTVGGTLSVGGVGGIVGGLRTGLQVDHVRELEVVTGTGDIQRCGPDRGRDLFEAVLGGLGQCGIITKAVVELTAAPQRARTYLLPYTDNAAFFRDLRRVVDRPGVDHVYAEFLPPGTTPTRKLFVTALYDPPAVPDDRAIAGDLSATPEIVDTSYLEYVFSIDQAIDLAREMVDWDRLIKPWFDVWIPGSVVEDYVAALTRTLTPGDIGPYGAGLIYAQRRTRVTRPHPRLPEPDGSPWVFVVDVNTVSTTVGPDPAYVEEMLDRNDRLFAMTRQRYGGVWYPIGSLRFGRRDWGDHFGDAWPDFRAAKRRYDPDGVLTPGPGIFGADAE